MIIKNVFLWSAEILFVSNRFHLTDKYASHKFMLKLCLIQMNENMQFKYVYNKAK